MRPLAVPFVLALCLTLPPLAEARSNNWLDIRQGLDAAHANPVIQVLNEKEQKAKNKACGPGHVFDKELGCIKRERAEKLKEKEKAEKAKQTPPPAKEDPNFCCSATTTQNGGGGFTSCAATEAEARAGGQKSAQQLGIPLSAMTCKKVN
jgi:hypothetical protein